MLYYALEFPVNHIFLNISRTKVILFDGEDRNKIGLE